MKPSAADLEAAVASTATTVPAVPLARVLFVCTGNICRSPTAHALLMHRAAGRGLSLEVDSAAISDEERGNPIDRRAAAELRRRGVPVIPHRARQVRAEDFLHFDWLIGMSHSHSAALHRLAPRQSRAQIALLLDAVPGCEGDEVPDPWYGDSRDFVRAFDLIERGVDAWLARWIPGG